VLDLLANIVTVYEQLEEYTESIQFMKEAQEGILPVHGEDSAR
jgi:hypothetical protein